MPPKVKEYEEFPVEFPPEEVARRRDEVVRRMLATPATVQVKGRQQGRRGRPVAT